MVNKNVFEKVYDFCIKNNIPARIKNHYHSKGKILQIWTCLNEYYNISIHKNECDEKYGHKRRTSITQQIFDTEMYRVNGDAYQGSYGRKLNYKTLIEELKVEFLK